MTDDKKIIVATMLETEHISRDQGDFTDQHMCAFYEPIEVDKIDFLGVWNPWMHLHLYDREGFLIDLGNNATPAPRT